MSSFIYISKRVQSKVVLFRLGYLCCFDLSVYTPLGHFDKCISNQVPLRTVSIYWIHPSAHYTCLVSTG